MVQKILGKSDIPPPPKKKEHIEGRLNEGPRLQRKHKDENEEKQNKVDTRERQDDIHPEHTSSRHLWLVNKGERTSTSPLPLGYLLDPSRHVWAYDCMP